MNSVYVTIEAPNMTYGRFYDDLDRFKAYAMRKREEGYGLTNARILERYGGLCLMLVMSKEAIASTSSAGFVTGPKSTICPRRLLLDKYMK